MLSTDMSEHNTDCGTLAAVWLIEVQARPEDADKIINKVMDVDPLVYGRYSRNAFISATGTETYLPQANSTSAVHLGAEGKVQTFPGVTITLSVQRDKANLGQSLTQYVQSITTKNH